MKIFKEFLLQNALIEAIDSYTQKLYDKTIENYNYNAPLWHSTASGDLKFAPYGIHVGTYQAAKEALQATIGIPAEGGWDGTREYGKTKLAGKKTLERIHKECGFYVNSGYNCGNDVPEEDYYPKDRKEKAIFSNGTVISPKFKPVIFPVQIVGKMSNTPHWQIKSDESANLLMRKNIKKGNANYGFYYVNEGEDEGSISAVVPNETWIKRLADNYESYHGKKPVNESVEEQALRDTVDTAAKKAGYMIKAYHGSKSKGIKEFNIPLDKYKVGFFASSSIETAKSFATWMKGVVYPVYLKMNKSFIVDAKKHSYYNIPIPNVMKKDFLPTMKTIDADNVAEWAYKNKYDSVIIKNVMEGTLNTSFGTDYIVFSPEQIKSAELVTYDDNGKPISLEKRFNTNSKNINEAMSDDQYQDFAEDYMYSIEDYIRHELLNGKKGDKISWNLIPAGRIVKIWKDYGKLGIIRDTKGLQEIKETILENIVKLYWCNALNGHDTWSPQREWQSSDDLTDEQMEHIAELIDEDFLSDKNGTWLVSDYGLKPLMQFAEELYTAKDDVEILTIIDKILNIAHQRSDLAAWFVEGGSNTLSRMSESTIISFKEYLTEDTKRDAFIVTESKRIFNKIKRKIDTIKLKKIDNYQVNTTKGKYSLKGLEFNLKDIGEKYDVNIAFLCTDRKIGGIKGFFDKQHNKVCFFIIDGDDREDWWLNSLLIRFKSWIEEHLFVHEFSHYLDSLKYSPSYKTSNNKEYYNSPEEIYAFYLETLRNKLNKRFFDLPFEQFLKKITNDNNYRLAYARLTPENKKRIKKRLYKLYMDKHDNI